MKPEEYAQKVLSDFGIFDIPALNFKKIFDACKITCDEMEYEDIKYSGSLHRFHDEAIILINTKIKNIGRINFTKAHELGHYFMKHKGNIFECTSLDIRTNDNQNKPFEVEANKFASEFLMPEMMIKPIVLSQPFDFDTINFICNTFKVSKTAAVFKMLDYVDGNYAVVFSQNGIVTHCKLSKNMMDRVKLLDKDNYIPESSFSYKVINCKLQMSGYTQLDDSCWIRNTQNVRVYEFARANQKYKTVLTLLYFELY